MQRLKPLSRFTPPGILAISLGAVYLTSMAPGLTWANATTLTNALALAVGLARKMIEAKQAPIRLSSSIDRRDVLAEVDGCEQRILFLIYHGNGEWQANVGLPRDLQPGTHQLRLRTRSSGFSNAMAFEFAP